MLSKREREYLADIEGFEDRNVFYGRVVRSRIRKKAERAIRDLILIIEKDGKGRQPAKAWRDRRNLEVLAKARRGEASEAELSLATFRAMLNRTWRGRREDWMIAPYLIFDLVCAYARKHAYFGEWMKEKIDEVLGEREGAHGGRS